MGFSPWAILAIVLTGVAVCALVSVHQWRIRVDRRQHPPPAAAAADEKTADDHQTAQQQPPSDLGESGHGPGPGAAAAPPEPTPSRQSAVSSSSAGNAEKASRGGCSSTVDERRHDDS